MEKLCINLQHYGLSLKDDEDEQEKKSKKFAQTVARKSKKLADVRVKEKEAKQLEEKYNKFYDEQKTDR